MPDYDIKFKEIDKKINDILYNKEIDEVKEEVGKLSDELITLKTCMGDILNRVNDNKTEIDEILNNLKEKKDNFNLASNLASLTPIIRTEKRSGEDIAQIEQMQEELDDLKHTLNSKLFEINVKLDMLSNNNSNETDLNKNAQEENRKSTGDRLLTKLKTFGPNKPDLNSGNLVGVSQLMKKIEEIDKNHRDLERSFKRLLSSFNLNNILDDIAKLKDSKADKADIPDSDSFNYLFDDIKIKINKFDSEIKEINQRLDNIFAKVVNQENKGELNTNEMNVNREILQAYLTKEEFDSYIKPRDIDYQKTKKELQKISENVSQLMITIKKKVDVVDLSNAKSFFKEKIDELARACNLKFADKNECLKNFKHIEEQLKKILFILKKRNDQSSEGEGNWLLAKKPIKGYSCAACESYLGELNNDVKKYVPWNRLPYRDTGELYRLGNGYSKMLQMINFDNYGNINISPDNNNINNDDIHTYISNDSNGMNSYNIHPLNKNNNNNNVNNTNNMRKTFYIKHKNIPSSKTPIKYRIQSAQDIIGERKPSLKNSNNLEENKINNFIIGNAIKTRNQKDLPNINFIEGESTNQKDPIITKIVKKSQSKKKNK